MAADLVIAPEAGLEIDEAYAWFEDRHPGLGEDFLVRVDACLRAICRSPEMHATIYKEYRKALVRRFPYAIFYEYEAGTVTVYCVHHTSRDPERWRSRLP
jgi:plasmid stabilization system protein ParE